MRRTAGGALIGAVIRAALLLLACLGCRALPRPPVRVDFEGGSAYATTAEAAARIADVAPDLVACVADLGHGSSPASLEIWLEDGPLDVGGKDADGASYHSRGLARVRDDLEVSASALLAHELAHLHFQPLVETLPWGVGEGVCDLVAQHCIPSDAFLAARMVEALQAEGPRFQVVLGYARNTRRLSLSLTGEPSVSLAEALESHDLPCSRGVGFVVAAALTRERGLEALLAECRDRADQGLILDDAAVLARVSPGGESVPDLARPLGTFEVVETMLGWIGPSLAILVFRSEGELSWEEFVDREPWFQVRGLAPRVPLDEVAPMQQALRALWTTALPDSP